MSDYILMTDSCCDLPASMAEQMQLAVLPLTVYIDDDSYRNELDGREIGFHEFYERAKTAKTLKTAAVNEAAFIECMEPYLAAGTDILYLGFSSGLSGTFNAAALAAQELKEKYPERKILLVDTLCASLGQGMLVHLCWQQKLAGKTIEEVAAYAEENKLHLAHWFTVNDLMFLKRGGRVSAATAVIGSALAIKPILHVDDEGHLIKVTTARGRKASIRALVDRLAADGVDIENQHLFICHGDCEDEANYLASAVRERFNVKDITVHYVGPVIGAHAGPGVLALFYLGSKR